MLERRGEVAYQLELPEALSRVHDVFHVSQLKKCHAEVADIVLRDTVPLDAIRLESDLTYEEKPMKILETAERVTAQRRSSCARFSGITTPKRRQLGSAKKI